MQDEHFLVGIAHDNDRYDGGFWGPISFTVKGGVFTFFFVAGTVDSASIPWSNRKSDQKLPKKFPI